LARDRSGGRSYRCNSADCDFLPVAREFPKLDETALAAVEPEAAALALNSA
jgi:hypothetical protein